jgi:hypothetical protein
MGNNKNQPDAAFVNLAMALSKDRLQKAGSQQEINEALKEENKRLGPIMDSHLKLKRAWRKFA